MTVISPTQVLPNTFSKDIVKLRTLLDSQIVRYRQRFKQAPVDILGVVIEDCFPVREKRFRMDKDAFNEGVDNFVRAGDDLKSLELVE